MMSQGFELTGRYQRQELLGAIGRDGQAALGRARITIVGCGALGTASAELLARAGVGALRLIDRDVVELTNLHRQLLFDEDDARKSMPKAVAASRHLGAINSEISIEPIVADVNPRTIERIVLESLAGGPRGPEVIVDGTDNFETRYLLNDLAVRDGIPLVYAGAVGTEGRAMTILPASPGARWGAGNATPCLRCVFPEPPGPGSSAVSATCDTVGVLGPVTTLMASIQATEAMKIAMGDFESIRSDLLSVDLWSGAIRQVELRSARRGLSAKDPCRACARREFPFLAGTMGAGSASLCGRNAVQIEPLRVDPPGSIDLDGLCARLAPHGSFSASRYLVRGRLEMEVGEGGQSIELTVFADGRAIVSGTARLERARGVYAKYVGA